MSEQYVMTVREMEEKFGPSPRVWDECPLCKSEPGAPHSADCPWLLWARSPIPGRVAS